MGEADFEVTEASGETRYTVEIRYTRMGKEKRIKCVLAEGGTKFYFKSIKTTPVCSLEWVTPEEASVRAARGDPIEAPPSHYRPEPERRGRLAGLGDGRARAGQVHDCPASEQGTRLCFLRGRLLLWREEPVHPLRCS